MHEKFMKTALNEAKKAYKLQEVPVGAVVELNGEIISKAHNLRHTKKVSTYHAEILAIQKACKKLNCWQLENCNLYVTLEPCLMCAGAIINSRIKNIYYGAQDKINGAYTAYNCNEFKNTYKTNVTCVNNSECSELLSKFFKELRNKKNAKCNCNHCE